MPKKEKNIILSSLWTSLYEAAKSKTRLLIKQFNKKCLIKTNI